MENLTDNQIEEIKDIKFILELLNKEPMTIGRIQNLCARKKLMRKDVTENHINFLLSQGMIIKKKEQGGDGWNTSYSYEVFALNNWWGEFLKK